MASVTIQWASPRPGPKLFRSRHIFKANKWGIACMLAIHETCSTINRQKLVQACRLSRITWWVKAASLHPNHVGRTTCGQVADACDANRQLGITKASDIYSCGEATQDPRPQEDSGKTRFRLFLILVFNQHTYLYFFIENSNTQCLKKEWATLQLLQLPIINRM